MSTEGKITEGEEVHAMKFREVQIGQTFYFDHRDLTVAHGLQRGPFVKVSPRCYTFEGLRGEVLRAEVGSINVTVGTEPMEPGIDGPANGLWW